MHLQKYEDNAIDQHELDRLRDHFEPLLRPANLRSSTIHTSHSHHSSSAVNAASAALRRDVRGLRQSTRSRMNIAQEGKKDKEKEGDGHDYPLFKASEFGRVDEDGEVEWLRALTDVSDVSRLEQRVSSSSWDETSRAEYVPSHSPCLLRS